MIPNALFYAHYFENVYAWQLNALERATLEKLLPTFDKIEKESEEASEAECQRLGSLPYTGTYEMDDLAEAAQNAGLAYFEAMTMARQVVLNSMAQALYHLFEQQIAAFCRHELLNPGEDPGKTFKPTEAFERISERLQIDREQFESFGKIDELRLVANTAKHAEGGSSKELHKRRPEMFVAPCIRGDAITTIPGKLQIYMPMAGQDFFIEARDLSEYFAAVRKFWSEMANKLKAAAPTF